MKCKRRINRTLLLILPLALSLFLAGCNGNGDFEKYLALSETEVSLMTGETKMLALTNPEEKDLGEYTVTWQSENEEIATVTSSGTVVAIANGSTKIIATVTAGDNRATFTCIVTVTQNTTPLSSLSFNANIYTLGDGQTLNLYDELSFYPTFAATRDLIWASSNQAIATVSNGIVLPVSEGITTITASTKDGKVSASCALKVSEISVEPTGIYFEEATYQVPRGKTLKLTYAVEPANATGYSILWVSSDPTVVSVAGGVVTGIKEGKADITATLTSGDKEFFSLCTVLVTEAQELIIAPTKVSLSPAAITIPEDNDGPFRFNVKVEPGNCNMDPVWTCNRSDILDIDRNTGAITVASAPQDHMVSVLVTCTIGNLTATGVVNVEPRAPKLEIVSDENSTIYDKAPLNTAELIAAYRGLDILPEILWESSDPTVATINANGIVTAWKAGSCTITATDKNDTNIKATYTLTVTKANFLSVKVDETVKVDPSLASKTDVEWNAPAKYLEVKKVGDDWFITGKSECPAIPTQISGYSASDGLLYTIKVYVVPKD